MNIHALVVASLASALTMPVFAETSADNIKPTRFAPYAVKNLEPRPDFWKVRPQEIMELCARASRCSRKEIICRTPLGYPVYALFYGDFSEPEPQTNWSAGNGSTTYHNYTGRPAGCKQTFLLLTGVHGAEPECVASAMNIIQLLETGADFRGQTDPELLELVSKYRLIVIPCLNMDGRAISPDHLRGVDWDTFRRVSQGVWKDGSRIGWRGSKSWFPLPLDKVSYPGGYPNADGYNLMHDACPGDIRTAEVRALLKVVARWRVDAVLNGHSYENSPSVLRPSGIETPEKRARGMAIRYRVNRILRDRGLLAWEPVPPEKDDPPGNSINLNNMMQLASGALALTLECSVSYDRPDRPPICQPKRKYTFEELMEPLRIFFREYLKDGLEKPFIVRGTEKVYGD